MKPARRLFEALIVVSLSLLAFGAAAQQRPPYGTAINLDTARKVGAAAEAEARKNGWNVAIAIVDNHGLLIHCEMLDDTQTASANVALEKARTAAIAISTLIVNSARGAASSERWRRKERAGQCAPTVASTG